MMKNKIKKIIDTGFWKLAMGLLWLKQKSDKILNSANTGYGQFWIFSKVEPSEERGAELGKADIQLLVDGLDPKQLKEIAIAIGGVALSYEKKNKTENKEYQQEVKDGEIVNDNQNG